jgi:EmrB/QacA subfamily drug resistance transporter
METTRNRTLMLVVICLGFFMIMLDTTIVYVATPSILTGLNSTLDQVLWVFNGYLLAYAVLLITAGRLADLYGPRNLFVAGLVVFTIASTLCGFSQDVDQLIAARVIQGVGGALLAPQSLTLLTTLFPAEKRGAAMGIWGMVVGVSTIAGPTLGGVIVTYLNWRWIFFVNVPVGIVAISAALALIPDVRPGKRHPMDLVGVFLASLALLLIVFGVIEGQRYEWSTITGWVTVPEVIGAGVVIFIAFFAWEARQSEPLVPLELFKDRNFTVMNWTGMAMQFGMQGIFIPMTIFMQSVLGMSALVSGLTFAPMSLASMVVSPIAGRLTDRIGGKWLLMFGLFLFAGGAAGTAWTSTLGSDWKSYLPWLIVTGIGLGLVFAPMTTVAMRNITPRQAGGASGVLNTTRQLGSVLGAAVVGAVLQNQLAASLRDQAASASRQLPQQCGFRPGLRDGCEEWPPGWSRPDRGGPVSGRFASRRSAPATGAGPASFRQRIPECNEADGRSGSRSPARGRGRLLARSGQPSHEDSGHKNRVG